jgi:hypothetical protein
MGHPLSAVRHSLFKIFAATFHIWRPFLHPQSEDAPCRDERNLLFMGKLTPNSNFCGSLQQDKSISYTNEATEKFWGFIKQMKLKIDLENNT